MKNCRREINKNAMIFAEGSSGAKKAY